MFDSFDWKLAENEMIDWDGREEEEEAEEKNKPCLRQLLWSI